MDTFITIIGLASFIYIFIFGAKAFKAKITPPPTDPFLQNYNPPRNTHLCEIVGMPCRIIYCEYFANIYTPRRLTRDEAEALIRDKQEYLISDKQENIITGSADFHIVPDANFYRPDCPMGVKDFDISSTSAYGKYLRRNDTWIMIFGFDNPS